MSMAGRYQWCLKSEFSFSFCTNGLLSRLWVHGNFHVLRDSQNLKTLSLVSDGLGST